MAIPVALIHVGQNHDGMIEIDEAPSRDVEIETNDVPIRDVTTAMIDAQTPDARYHDGMIETSDVPTHVVVTTKTTVRTVDEPTAHDVKIEMIAVMHER